MSTEEPLDVDELLVSERQARERERAAWFGGVSWIIGHTRQDNIDTDFPAYPPRPPKLKTVPRTFTRSDGAVFQFYAPAGSWRCQHRGATAFSYLCERPEMPNCFTAEDVFGLADLMRTPTEEVPE